MKNMSAWAIRHPVTPVVLFVVLVCMGLVAFFRLPRTLNPDISFPGVQVLVSQPGASPQEIETQIMQKVEAAVASIGNIDNITSLAIEGQSRVFIEFAIGTPIDRAVADVRDAVSKVRVDLPAGIQEPTVVRMDADGQPARLLRRQQQRAHGRGPVLVRRQHPEQAPARRRGRLAGLARRRRQPRDPHRAGPGAHASPRGHRRTGERAAAPAEPRLRRRPGAAGRRRAGDPRAWRGAQRQRPGRHADHALRRALRPPVGPGHRQGQRRGDPLARAPQRPPGDHLQHPQGQGHFRHLGDARCRCRGRQDPEGEPERRDQPDLHHRQLHQEDLSTRR